MTMGAFDLAAPHQFVEGQPRLVALAIAQPADARGQPLEVDALARHAHPAGEGLVLREEAQDLLVGAVDVFGIAGERHPAERALAATEERADERGHEAGEVHRVLDARAQRLPAQVVAVVEDDRAHLVEVEHRAHVLGHRVQRAALILLRVALAQLCRLVERQPGGNVAVERVVRGGLVGDEVHADATADDLREDLGGVAEQADAARDALRLRYSSARRSASSRSVTISSR